MTHTYTTTRPDLANKIARINKLETLLGTAEYRNQLRLKCEQGTHSYVELMYSLEKYGVTIYLRRLTLTKDRKITIIDSTTNEYLLILVGKPDGSIFLQHTVTVTNTSNPLIVEVLKLLAIQDNTAYIPSDLQWLI